MKDENPTKNEALFLIANDLEMLEEEFKKLTAVMEAFEEFAGIQLAELKFTAIQTNPEQFNGLYLIIVDYVIAIADRVSQLAKEAYEYSRKAKNA